MASTAVALARRLLPELPIVVRTRPENFAAQAVAVKLGLRRAAFLDDHMLTYVSRWEPPPRVCAEDVATDDQPNWPVM